MNISTLAKILGVSISELRETGQKNQIHGFYGRNTRINYQAAIEVTKILRPEKASKLKNDDKIYLPSTLTVSEFAESIDKNISIIIKTLILNGVIATINEKIDFDTASLIAGELNVEVFAEVDGIFAGIEVDTKMMKTIEYDEKDKKYTLRPPVITIMGHVDHGKTTLLDTIRQSNVVATEAGAITQHISSYSMEYLPENEKEILPNSNENSTENSDEKSNKKPKTIDTELTKNEKLPSKLNLIKGKIGYKLTFVDTPGHEAFVAMRARGSQLADIVILVVSAVEGPKPQTVEVIERIKMAKTPVIVALNKIDLPQSDIERAKQEVAKYGLVPEEWGGDVPFIPISAKNKLNIDKLLEQILNQAEMMELKGEIDCKGQAVIIESHLDTQLGVVATALIIKEKLKIGDLIVCGESIGKIKKLQDSNDKILMEAGLSEPVLLVGLPNVCDIGEPIVVYPNQKLAQNAVNLQITKRNNSKKSITSPLIGGVDGEINVILKADVSGSLEALEESIFKIPQEKVKIIIKAKSVGEIFEGDLDFAKTTNATILCFHTDWSSSIDAKIKKEKINVIQSNVIYEILAWLEEQVIANTKHEVKIIPLGKAKILACFKSEKASVQVLGGECLEGKITGSKVLRVWRDNKEIGRAEIVELQRNKIKAAEVNISQQFGLSITSKIKLQVGDIIESIDEILVK